MSVVAADTADGGCDVETLPASPPTFKCFYTENVLRIIKLSKDSFFNVRGVSWKPPIVASLFFCAESPSKWSGRKFRLFKEIEFILKLRF